MKNSELVLKLKALKATQQTAAGNGHDKKVEVSDFNPPAGLDMQQMLLEKKSSSTVNLPPAAAAPKQPDSVAPNNGNDDLINVDAIFGEPSVGMTSPSQQVSKQSPKSVAASSPKQDPKDSIDIIIKKLEINPDDRVASGDYLQYLALSGLNLSQALAQANDSKDTPTQTFLKTLFPNFIKLMEQHVWIEHCNVADVLDQVEDKESNIEVPLSQIKGKHGENFLHLLLDSSRKKESICSGEYDYREDVRTFRRLIAKYPKMLREADKNGRVPLVAACAASPLWVRALLMEGVNFEAKSMIKSLKEQANIKNINECNFAASLVVILQKSKLEQEHFAELFGLLDINVYIINHRKKWRDFVACLTNEERQCFAEIYRKNNNGAVYAPKVANEPAKEVPNLADLSDGFEEEPKGPVGVENYLVAYQMGNSKWYVQALRDAVLEVYSSLNTEKDIGEHKKLYRQLNFYFELFLRLAPESEKEDLIGHNPLLLLNVNFDILHQLSKALKNHDGYLFSCEQALEEARLAEITDIRAGNIKRLLQDVVIPHDWVKTPDEETSEPVMPVVSTGKEATISVSDNKYEARIGKVTFSELVMSEIKAREESFLLTSEEGGVRYISLFNEISHAGVEYQKLIGARFRSQLKAIASYPAADCFLGSFQKVCASEEKSPIAVAMVGKMFHAIYEAAKKEAVKPIEKEKQKKEIEIIVLAGFSAVMLNAEPAGKKAFLNSFCLLLGIPDDEQDNLLVQKDSTAITDAFRRAQPVALMQIAEFAEQIKRSGFEKSKVYQVFSPPPKKPGLFAMLGIGSKTTPSAAPRLS